MKFEPKSITGGKEGDSKMLKAIIHSEDISLLIFIHLTIGDAGETQKPTSNRWFNYISLTQHKSSKQ